VIGSLCGRMRVERWWPIFQSLLFVLVGSGLAAWAIRIFLLPNQIIDGGVVGISLIARRLGGESWFSPVLILLNLPFVLVAYHRIRKNLVLFMLTATLLFLGFMTFFENFEPFFADSIEIIFVGGVLLGIGIGLIIRGGGCLDGTEILAILINQKTGFTVGQVVLTCNIFIFGAYGILFRDWHIALQSLMTYIVAYKVMDIVIVGLDDVKSVLVISNKPQKVSDAILHEMGLGLTVMYGRGGFTGESKELLYVIVERLQLSELKEVISRHDPQAFIAIQNIHEVVYGHHDLPVRRLRYKSSQEPS